MGEKIRTDLMHFSTAQCFEQCPARFKFRYVDHIDTIENDDPANALKIGTALHKGIETDLDTALHEYFMSYPIITNAHINEAIKLEHWIPRVKELLPEGLHEVNMMSDWYEGTMDLIVPCTKHDASLPHGQFDLYDFKYSNNQSHYMESKQLHVYKHFCEQILGKRIRKMFFVFVPKTNIKQKRTETLEDFRKRISQELSQVDVEIKEVEYDPEKVIQFFETCMKIHHSTNYPKEQSYLCDWCEYKEFCLKGEETMILPKAERRQVGQITKRKLWIYGSAFSGKTTFVDNAPMPLNLNTDGNIQFVTMPYIPIKDTYEGRIKVLAWDNFKKTIAELEKGDNEFKTIVVDLLEDTYESCRLYMYDKLGITHESDDSFRAWDKVRTEFLSTIRKLINLDYENIILISHENSTKDITKKSGDRITEIKPNIADKVANKVAGMVDIVARVVAEDDGTRTLNFKSDEVIFGGGRLKNISKTQIPLDWDELCKVYDEANGAEVTKFSTGTKKSEKVINSSDEDENPVKTENKGSDRVSRRSRTKKESVVESFNDLPEEELAEEVKKAEAEDAEMKASQESIEPNTGEVIGQEVEAPKKRTRRVRKERNDG